MGLDVRVKSIISIGKEDARYNFYGSGKTKKRKHDSVEPIENDGGSKIRTKFYLLIKNANQI